VFYSFKMRTGALGERNTATREGFTLFFMDGYLRDTTPVLFLPGADIQQTLPDHRVDVELSGSDVDHRSRATGAYCGGLVRENEFSRGATHRHSNNPSPHDQYIINSFRQKTYPVIDSLS
jgi:hypothetical protein